MKDYKNLTEEDIVKALNDFEKGRLEYINTSPYLEVTSSEDYFMVKINSQGINLMTGKGGLKMFLNNPIPFLKVKFNDKVLNQEEYIEFVNTYK